jgi:hypothetical protein
MMGASPNHKVRLTGKAPAMSKIPTKLAEKQFEKYIGPSLSQAKAGFSSQIPNYKLFNYILYWLYTGCQWQQIPIATKPGSEKKKLVTVRSIGTFLSGARMAV